MTTVHIDREAIVPATMRNIVEQKGYLPGLRAGGFLFVAGQVGRTADLQVITDPEAQFTACFENLRTVLAAGGCTFADIVDITSFHVDMHTHWPAFRAAKNRLLPREVFPWTAIGVSSLAAAGLLLEVKATAFVPITASGAEGGPR
jgi:enamine deaminase RidA (YjgF/YER057c/UK114 family)